MGDEKTRAQPGDKKQGKPPAPVQQQAPKDQHTGPARAVAQKQPAAPQPASDHHKATRAGQTAAMQQSVGNQQVNRTMRATREPGKDPHTPHVKVSHPEDAAEKEAEAVARKVTSDQPAHPHDHPGPAPGDPAKVAGDPSTVHGDPDVVHRVAADHDKTVKPQPTAPRPAAAQPPAPAGPSPTSILDHPGPGQPVPQPTRGTLEAKLKADLSHVVVHRDAEADKAVRRLHARAVTRGDHIFLASDASPYDLSLMAHEITHVLHHNNDTVHRQTDGTAPQQGGGTPSNKKYYDDKEGVINITGAAKTIEIPSAPYAKEKHLGSGIDVYGEFARSSRTVQPRGTTAQKSKWYSKLDLAKTTEKVKNLAAGTATVPPSPQGAPPPGLSATGTPVVPPANRLYLLRYSPRGGPVTGTSARHAEQGVLIGTVDDLAKTAGMPFWDQHGKFNRFNLDHVLERQVGGADEFENLWMWETVANQSGGSNLYAAIKEKVDLLLNAAREKHKGDPGPSPLPVNRDSVSSDWQIKIGKLEDGLAVRGDPAVYWTSEMIKEGKAAEPLTSVTPGQAAALGLYPGGSQSYLVIIAGGKGGGGLIRVPWKDGQTEAKGPALDGVFDQIYPHLTVSEVTYDPSTKKGTFVAAVTSKLIQGNVQKFDPPMTLSGYGSTTGSMLVAKLNGEQLAQKVGSIHFSGMSLITINEAELVPYSGFEARGVLQPSIPLLKGTPIDVVFSGSDIWLEKTFDAKNIPAPAPLKITNGAITVSAGTQGLQIGGSLSLALGTVATGTLSAQVDSRLNFSLVGSIDFDKTLFQPANLTFTYDKAGADYLWGISGTLGIPPNKVPGIQQATVNASYAGGTFTASGNATLNVPGLQSGSLLITYAERDGISIGGTFGLAPNPVIESGTVSATVSKRPPGNRWALSANGTVKPKIPGVDTTLSASYEDGVFTVEGSAAYARGILSGSLAVGLTNRPMDPQGHPAGAPHAGAPLRPYGGGTLTVRIAPWLQGTVGVQLQPDGSVQLMGEIALPQSVDLFKAMQVQKNLLNIGMDIPIVGVAVMGQRIGIFATIQGGLDASASIGPGQLRQLSLRVRYNPEHEDQTQITGGAQLFVPAQAGLRLYVRGALGAGIPVVSAEAGLEIGGQLGVEGAVQAGVTVNWTPKRGLVIDAPVSLSAEPSFTFDINGYVKVGADLVLTSTTLYEKRWQLASFRYGSGLHVGVRAPIHYEQGKPFTFSLSDVQFDLPKIDPTQVLTDLVHKIA